MDRALKLEQDFLECFSGKRDGLCLYEDRTQKECKHKVKHQTQIFSKQQTSAAHTVYICCGIRLWIVAEPDGSCELIHIRYVYTLYSISLSLIYMMWNGVLKNPTF